MGSAKQYKELGVSYIVRIMVLQIDLLDKEIMHIMQGRIKCVFSGLSGSYIQWLDDDVIT